MSLFNDRPHPGLLPQEKENRFPSYSQTKRCAGRGVSRKTKSVQRLFPLLGERVRVRAVVITTFLILSASYTFAEDQTLPTIHSMIGGLLFDGEHLYVAESQVGIPLYYQDQFSFFYRQHEITPVFKEGAQTQLLSSRNELEGNFSLGENFRAIGIGGYRRSALEDRAGSIETYALGAGFGSPLSREPRRFEWTVTAGGYLGREHLSADWWADAHLAWRAIEFDQGQMLDSTFKPWLGLAADIESANDGGQFHGFYRVGPALEVISGNGNRARFLAQWFANDGNPLMENRYSAMLIGIEVNASFDADKMFDARDIRKAGWLPLVWGQYDVGYGGERSIQRTELNTEVHDFSLWDHIFTAVLNYESRQEYRPGDYDNVSYTVSLGLQSQVGLASPLSQEKPLVMGVEYLHRSAHSLAPDADRVPPPTIQPHSSLNLAPRVRLQTIGWDLPYRDSARYRGESRWLNDFDWRLTLGYDVHHTRDRPNPAAQVGLNWDAATIKGCVLYARGLASYGNETPDWLAEIGVRRPIGKLFLRYESYGLEDQIARGNTFVVGIGFNL
jgi:hypothetical protein